MTDDLHYTPDWAMEILGRLLPDGATITRGADDAAIGLRCWSLSVGDAELYADITDAEMREVDTERLPLLIVDRWGARAGLFPDLRRALLEARDVLGAEADRRELQRRRRLALEGDGWDDADPPAGQASVRLPGAADRAAELADRHPARDAAVRRRHAVDRPQRGAAARRPSLAIRAVDGLRDAEPRPMTDPEVILDPDGCLAITGARRLHAAGMIDAAELERRVELSMGGRPIGPVAGRHVHRALTPKRYRVLITGSGGAAGLHCATDLEATTAGAAVDAAICQAGAAPPNGEVYTVIVRHLEGEAAVDR